MRRFSQTAEIQAVHGHILELGFGARRVVHGKRKPIVHEPTVTNGIDRLAINVNNTSMICGAGTPRLAHRQLQADSPPRTP